MKGRQGVTTGWRMRGRRMPRAGRTPPAPGTLLLCLQFATASNPPSGSPHRTTFQRPGAGAPPRPRPHRAPSALTCPRSSRAPSFCRRSGRPPRQSAAAPADSSVPAPRRRPADGSPVGSAPPSPGSPSCLSDQLPHGSPLDSMTWQAARVSGSLLVGVVAARGSDS